jgi:hypothetical protein
MMGSLNLNFDRIIIGAGFYGLYAALFCAKRGETVLVLEYDDAPFKRATYINQARVHMGYHYPRSLSTAIKSKGYFDRFSEDYNFSIHCSFDQIYAVSSNFTWTSAEQFKRFCKNAEIPCNTVSPDGYFKQGLCDGAFLTKEYTYDAGMLKEFFGKVFLEYPKVNIRCNARIQSIRQESGKFIILLDDQSEYSASFILNVTYAGINQIHALLGFEPFKIKYELCEIILCTVNDELRNIGITVMDGPFFSIMPFGKTGFHSLTSVTFTPHSTSFGSVPAFPCQRKSGGFCSPERLGNCGECPAKPESAWPYMSNLARKYIRDTYQFEYAASLFSMKPILQSSEIDDSRPTVIRQMSRDPDFFSVLSGKINTVYDLDGVLSYGQ